MSDCILWKNQGALNLPRELIHNDRTKVTHSSMGDFSLFIQPVATS